MAGRLRNEETGRKDARPRHDAIVDRLFQPEGRATHVAHSGETTHQHAPGTFGCHGSRILVGRSVDQIFDGIVPHDVDMRITHPRRQGAPIGIDHGGIVV